MHLLTVDGGQPNPSSTAVKLASHGPVIIGLRLVQGNSTKRFHTLTLFAIRTRSVNTKPASRQLRFYSPVHAVSISLFSIFGPAQTLTDELAFKHSGA